MTEHVHLLLWPTEEDYDISQILKSIKQSVSSRALEFVKEHAPDFLHRMEDRQPNGKCSARFWQRGGGYDRNLFEPATIYQQINYIHNNPVRRELCETPEEWTWSSAADYSGVRIGPLSVDREWLPAMLEIEG